MSLNFSAFLYISPHFSAFFCISLNFSAFLCISLHFTSYFLGQFDGAYHRPMDAICFKYIYLHLVNKFRGTFSDRVSGGDESPISKSSYQKVFVYWGGRHIFPAFSFSSFFCFSTDNMYIYIVYDIDILKKNKSDPACFLWWQGPLSWAIN